MNRTMMAVLASTMVAACGGSDDLTTSALPQLGAATPANLSGTCDALAAKLAFANTVFTSVKDVPAGTLRDGFKKAIPSV